MNEVMEFPPIEEAPPSAIAVLPPQSAALTELSKVDLGIAQLIAEHGSTNYDITTPLGYKLATARRYAIRQVRFRVPKVVEARKAELRGAAAAVTAEGERIIAALRAIEDPHHALIEAEDARRAAIKAEQDRIEAEKKAEAARVEAARVAAHESRLGTIRSYLTHAQGLPSSRIALGISTLIEMTIDQAVWDEDYAPEASRVLQETLDAMRDLFERTKAAEDAEAAAKAEAARLEAQRIEQERIAAEQAERQRVIDEQCAELRRRQEALDAEAKRLEDEEAARMAAATSAWERDCSAPAHQDAQSNVDAAPQPAQSTAKDYPVEQGSQHVLKAEAGTPDATDSDALADVSPRVGAMGAGQAADAAPVDVRMVTIGQIHKALGFNVGGAFLGSVLGINAQPSSGKAVLYTRDDALRGLDALAAHVITTKEKL